jgi:ATP-dependent DNA ligase
MPDETVIDGEVVALDADSRPSIQYPPELWLDPLILKEKDVMGEPLTKRRALIEKHILPKLADPIRYSPVLEASLKDLVASVKAQGLEGLVAKRRDSKFQAVALRPGF